MYLLRRLARLLLGLRRGENLAVCKRLIPGHWQSYTASCQLLGHAHDRSTQQCALIGSSDLAVVPAGVSSYDPHLHISTLVQQQADDFLVAHGGGPMQRRRAVLNVLRRHLRRAGEGIRAGRKCPGPQSAQMMASF